MLQLLVKGQQEQAEATLRMARIAERDSIEAQRLKAAKRGTMDWVTTEDELVHFATRLCDTATVSQLV